MNRFSNCSGDSRDKRVAVLGDLVADVFIYGEISRISREAPVLILNHRETQLVPGGGANAVYNLQALGAMPLPDRHRGRRRGRLATGRILPKARRSTLAAFAWRNPSGRRRRRAFLPAPCTHNASRSCASIPAVPLATVRKLSPTAAVVRCPASFRIMVTARSPRNLSDAFAAMDIPATIDSRFSLDRFTNMTAATPNEPEVEAALGIHDRKRHEEAGIGRTDAAAQTEASTRLITRGKDGMALFERGKKDRAYSDSRLR